MDCSVTGEFCPGLTRSDINKDFVSPMPPPSSEDADGFDRLLYAAAKRRTLNKGAYGCTEGRKQFAEMLPKYCEDRTGLEECGVDIYLETIGSVNDNKDEGYNSNEQ